MLPIAKIPSYLSPSSLNALEVNPNKFYMERMCPTPAAREPQGAAAGVGSAFDVYVKCDLINNRLHNLDVVFKRLLDDTRDSAKRTKYAEMTFKDAFLEASIEQQPLDSELAQQATLSHFDNSVQAGLMIYNLYKKSEIFKDTEYVDVEIHKYFTLLNENVPLFMKLDASVMLNHGSLFKKDMRLSPHDWKVMGYGSKDGASPPPGYKSITSESGESKGCHANYAADMAWDTIDPKWATQIATYGWGLGIPPGKPFKSSIDAVIIRPTGIRFARYEAWITAEFQKQLVDRYRQAWYSLQNGSFLNRICSEPKLVEYFATTEKWYGKR